jgi:hypothetical protein
MTSLAQQIIQCEIAPPPIVQLNGIVLVEADPGRAVMRYATLPASRWASPMSRRSAAIFRWRPSN